MTVLITGASRGIGLALAVHAHQHKAEVIATYRGDDTPAQKGVEWHRLDVTNPVGQKDLSAQLAGRPL